MRRRLLKTLTTLALSVLMIVSVISAFVLGIGADKPINAIAEVEQTYTKVTSTPTDWSGEYLIVYEDGKVAFDGSLGSLDAVSNTKEVSITDGKITGDFANYTFIIEKVEGGYSIKSKSGYYIGQTSDANGLKSSTSTAYTNTISLDGDGNVNIKSSGGAYLRYNATSGQTRFRYYKSSSYTSQKAITLYKLEENAGGSDPECAHTNTENREATAPTCTENGYEAGVYCKDCGTYISGHEEINALGHDEVNHEAKAATCTEVGWDAYVTCSRCDYTTYVEIPKIAHTYENGVCTECGAEEPATYALVTDVNDLNVGSQIIIAAFASDVALSTTQNTNNRGQAAVTKSADKSEVTFEESVGVQIITLKEGTITGTFAFNVDTTDYLYAASSSSNQLKTQTTNDANSSWTISITPEGVATIKAQGTNTRNLLSYNLGSSIFSCYGSVQKDISIYKLDCSHANTEAIGETKEATCTTDGITAGKKCSVCGEILEAQTVIPATGHKDEDKNGICDICLVSLCKEHAWEETSRVNATCTEDGSVDSKCSVCGETKTEALSATGHTEVIDEAVAATCTATGLTEGKHCSVCGEVLVAQTTVDKSDHIYENGSCTMCGKTLPFKVGDVVIFTGSKADGTVTQELTGFKDGDTFGTAAVYTGTPAGTFPITVVKGYQDDTYAFKNSENYITCNGEKNVNLSATLDAKSSWTVDLVNGTWQIKSCSDTTLYLQYNSGAPRFTTYTGSQQPIKVVKYEPVLKGVALALNKGVTVKVTYDVPELWLNANAGAKVVFSNGEKDQSFEATAGESVYSVDLTPAQINDTLTVKIQLANGNDFGSETDVSVSAYKAKVEAAYANGKLGYSQEKFEALIALLDAALIYSNAADGAIEGNLSNDFEGVGDATIVHGKEEAKLFTGYAGTLGTYASVKVGVNTGNIQDGDKLVIKINGNEFYNDDIAKYLEDGLIILDGIYPLNFDDTIYIEATNEGSSATFTFNAYLKAVYGSSTTEQSVKNMAVATYLYGLAAENFKALPELS